MIGHKHPHDQCKIMDPKCTRNTELNSLSDYFFEQHITKELWGKCPTLTK